MQNPRSWRLELEGWVLLIFLLSLGWMAWRSGSPRISLIAASLGGLAVVELVLGGINLRGLRVERRVDGEIFALAQVHGRLLVRNDRALGSAWAIKITESPGSEGRGESTARLHRVGSRQRIEVDACWVFQERGNRLLRGLVLESRWPFGLIRRRRTLVVEDRVLVYPSIGTGGPVSKRSGSSQVQASQRGRGIVEGFQGLREYQPGDPLRWIHWPTSARTRRPMVVLRPDRASEEVVVEVKTHPTRSWEEVLSGAVAQVLRELETGLAVGLSLSGVLHPPRRGGAWRRHLLAELARAPDPRAEEST